MNGMVLFLLALVATGTAFAGFAWLFISALNEGTGNFSDQMGVETSRAFEDIFLFIPPARIARLGRLAALAAFFTFFIPFFSLSDMLSTGSGITLGVIAAGCALMAPGKLVKILRMRRRVRFEEQLVDALATMSNALRAGFSINQAIGSVVESGENPIAQEFGVMLRQLRIGMSFEEALDSIEARVRSDDLSLVCTAIDIARKTGGNLTGVFDSISKTIRGRLRVARRVRTLTAQGRLQGIVVSILPLFLGVAMTILKPSLMIPFLTSFGGIVCIAISASLVTIGWLIIRKIIRIEV